MKFYPKLGVYKNSTKTNIFNPQTNEAFSYGWWKYFMRHPKVGYVFNNYSYSVSTSKHQRELQSILRERGIKYKTIQAPSGLDNLDSAMEHQFFRLKEIVQVLTNKRRKKALDKDRLQTYVDIRNDIKLLIEMGVELSKEQKTILFNSELTQVIGE